MSSVDIFYFGAWDKLGHHIWTPRGTVVARAGPWTARELDAHSYATHHGKPIATGRGFVPVDPEETEGTWVLRRANYRLEPWTAIGCYDRTLDPRNGSVSVFVANGEYSEFTIKALAAQHFPAVWARITGVEPVAYMRGALAFLTWLCCPFPIERRVPVWGDEGTITWEEHLKTWRAYAERYGSQQSASQIADRGGFSYREIVELIGVPKSYAQQ